MLNYLLRRLLHMIPMMAVISELVFVIIQLPPGDFLTSLVAQMSQTGAAADEQVLDSLRHRYGLDRPKHVQYLQWIGGCLRGDFGWSFEWNRPVRELIGQRLFLTLVVSLSSMLFMWVVAIPIGVCSAMHKYTWRDHALTLIGFLGISVPSFMLALIVMFVGMFAFGVTAGGLFSPEYANAPWSFARGFDLLKHLWIPVLVVGAGGTAQLVRIMRSNLLDVLGEPFVTTARAKGLKERVVLHKFAVRVAVNPLISIMGMQLPQLISGVTVAAIVLGLPTIGPLFLRSLQNQDMYLAGTILMFLAFLLLIGNLLADILLALVDPRIVYE